MADHEDPVGDPAWPGIEAYDPNDPALRPHPEGLSEGYETDLSAVGTQRQAAPPDGIEQHWTEVHPGAATFIHAGVAQASGEAPA